MNSLLARVVALVVSVWALFTMSAVAGGIDVDRATVVLLSTATGLEGLDEAVVLAVPVGDRHMGFLLNAPGDEALAELLPDEDTGSRSHDIVFSGGPEAQSVLFALVRRNGEVLHGLRDITGDLALASRSEEVDQVISDPSAEARFYRGVLVWGPGELGEQVENGAWRVLAADARIVMTADPGGLWRRLSNRVDWPDFARCRLHVTNRAQAKLKKEE